MLAEAAMGVSALQTAFNLAKGLKDLNTAVAVNTAVIELQESIITAQQAQAALIKRVDDLEAQVASFEAWESEKQKYELKGLKRTGIAYVLKPEERTGKPPHGICPQCYERRIKSVLQSNGQIQWHVHFWLCAVCQTKVHAGTEAFEEVFSEA